MPSPKLDSHEFEKLVADALEHLWDHAYLGKHPLAELECVSRRMSSRTVRSHVDVGRMLNQVLLDAIENLRPPRQTGFSRERHYYGILYKAYVAGEPNKAIAHSLDISERTFYRHNAKAIQIVARVLFDWEQ